ncbi:MAG: alpha/beta hydrolase [Limisphaerales bacterium]
MKALLTCLLATMLATLAAPAAETPLPLWPDGAPGALGEREQDRPTLTPFRAPAERATGAAIVVLPGGGYGGLAQHEGPAYAEWLNSLGVHAFVLKYRLGSHGYRHPRMLEDAARAVRLVRARAADWGVDPARVGIMGSSAGGHLASTLLTHFDASRPDAADAVDRQSSRPDLGVLCYPVISLGEFTHQGSKKNLLGENPPADLVQLLSNELQVTKDTPPTFLWHTVEDAAVPVENSLLFAAALRKAGVPFDLHVYEKGRHGIGLADGHPWTKDLEFWLRQRGWLK